MTDSSGTFEDFVAGRGKALLRFAYLLSRDQALAEDLVQEALVKAHRRWQQVLRTGRCETYVRRIVVNEYASWRRRRRNSELPGAIPDAPQADLWDARAERDAMWQALAGLPPRQRAVLVLRYYEGLPDPEIAAVLGCAEGSVRSLASRAFAALREHPDLRRVPLEIGDLPIEPAKEEL